MYKVLSLKARKGQLSLEVVFFSAVVVIVMTGFIFWALSFLKLSVRSYHKASAFSIAEAGIEYYRWHLAHAPDDFQDGTGHAGPYEHDYYDKNGNVIGSFTLDITPPPSGSTIVTIQSSGKVAADSSVEKIIKVKLGIPSFAKYAVAAADYMRFGAGTEVFGEVMSNGGIRFDGLAHNFVRSAVSTTTDPDFDACTTRVWGVHTCVNPADPAPPTAIPSRPDIFLAGREMGVPALNFFGMTQDLSSIRNQASSSGVYVPSSTLGYELVLKTNNTYDIFRVTSLVPVPSNCSNVASSTGWGTWSVQAKTTYSSGTIPTNGLFFFEDNVWVRGQVNGARVTVASGKLPDFASTRTSITVNSDLLYSKYDGSDVIALIAQNNINIGLVASDTLRIDAALVAQNGRVGRYYYQPASGGKNRCSPYDTRQSITSYGMIGTNHRYGFAYTDGTGYKIRNLVYDSNLLYAPPPSFPRTGDNYAQISWDEVK